MEIREALSQLAEQHGTPAARSKAGEWGIALDEIYQCTGSLEAYILGAQVQEAANELLTLTQAVDFDDLWSQSVSHAASYFGMD